MTYNDFSADSNNRHSFLTKGFCLFKEPQLCDIIKIDWPLVNTQERLRDNFEKDLPKEANKALLFVSNYLKATYVNQLYPGAIFKKYGVWEGVDSDSTHWHNDFFEGMNCFFLLYFDDMSPETGGAIHLKWPTGEETIYPKRGDCVFLNQSLQFFHRADKASIPRRISSFDYFAEELDI